MRIQGWAGPPGVPGRRAQPSMWDAPEHSHSAGKQTGDGKMDSQGGLDGPGGPASRSGAVSHFQRNERTWQKKMDLVEVRKTGAQSLRP